MEALIKTICIWNISNLCSTLVCGSNFLQFGSIYRGNAQKKAKKVLGKSLNTHRQLFRDVHFWTLVCLT